MEEDHYLLKDEFSVLEQKIHAADDVVFATSVYVMNVSGLMKVFIDHFSYICIAPAFLIKKLFFYILQALWS